MSERERWLPTDDEIAAKLPDRPLYESCGEEFDPADLYEPIRALISAAVERALAEQQARHRREVIEARIAELENWYDSDADDAIGIRLTALRSELAALEVKP